MCYLRWGIAYLLRKFFNLSFDFFKEYEINTEKKLYWEM